MYLTFLRSVTKRGQQSMKRWMRHRSQLHNFNTLCFTPKYLSWISESRHRPKFGLPFGVFWSLLLWIIPPATTPPTTQQNNWLSPRLRGVSSFERRRASFAFDTYASQKASVHDRSIKTKHLMMPLRKVVGWILGALLNYNVLFDSIFSQTFKHGL